MRNIDDSAPLLYIQNASVVRGERRVLDDISLSIADGEHVAIVGPNGSGKSTIIKLITRQLYPLAGQDQNAVVEIFGRDRWNVFELRSMLGILSNDMHQDFIADDTMDALEAVLSGFFASKGVAQHQIVTAAMRHAAAKSLEIASATSLAKRKMSELSTGEARRVLIARALVSNPRALILDEPTGGLDIAARRRFLHSVREIALRHKTVILVTHHVEEIIPEIDRVILIKDGKIFRDGAKKDILTGDILSELFDEQIQLRENNGYYSAEVELLSSDRISDPD